MMSSIKTQIPTSKELMSKLESVLSGDLPDFLSSTEDGRESVKANARFTLTAVFFLLAIFVFLFLADVQIEEGWFSRFILGLAMLWTIIFLLSGRAWFLNTKLLAREMNMALAPVFSNIFDRQFLYTNNQDNEGLVLNLLQTSALITSNDISVQSDDSYYVYGEHPIEFHELTVSTKGQAEGQDKIELFKGLLVVAKLPKIHSAETYISTDGDRTGFAHRTFWSDLLGGGTVKETVLEWNDFEDKLHVATSDGAAAREVLTPEFMSDLYAWWNEHKLNMRIALKGDQLFLLMPESTIHIASSTTSSKLSVIKQYAASLARPMWRSFMLIEDVSR